LFEIISSLLKYIFITVIYLFIFGIIRLIYLDIGAIYKSQSLETGRYPYLKLVNRREELDFKVSETYPLVRDVMIGRKGKNDIAIKDPFLSGKHASIIEKDGKYLLDDVGSTNGTFLNGIRLRPKEGTAILKDGDRIHLGQIDFLFVSKG
jgi:pSer/pThr/pTyr-binding forkhead associated (FHA) protein